eukprot:scaffold414954_cov43-Prasinocladus_malaysianus.AAC.1
MLLMLATIWLLMVGGALADGLHQQGRSKLGVAVGVAIFAEAQQDGVDGHLVDLKEHRRAYVRDDDGQRDGRDGRRQKRLRVLLRVGVELGVGEEERHDATAADDAQLAEEDEEVADDVDGREAEDVAQQETHRARSRRAVPHAALDATHAPLEQRVGVLQPFGLPVDVFQKYPYELDDGEDERAEGDAPEVIPAGHAHRPQHGPARHEAANVAPVPIVMANGGREDDIPIADDELDGPKQAEEVVEAHVEERVVPSHLKRAVRRMKALHVGHGRHVDGV